MPKELISFDQPIGLQSGSLLGPFYADLSNPRVRRDIQRHSAIGGLVAVGNPSTTTYTDLFAAGGAPSVAAGTGWALTVPQFVLQSRYTGAQIVVPAASVTIPGAPVYGTRIDNVVAAPNSAVSIVPGPADLAVSPTFEVATVATTGVPTGGSFRLSFDFNGFWYQTANIAYSAAASAVASAVLAAVGGPEGAALSALVPSGTLTGSGGPLTTGTVTLTAGGGLEGNIYNLQVVSNLLTGGTAPSANVVTTTAGSGVSPQVIGANYLILATVATPSTATSAANSTISTTLCLTA
jgi:hypothetical protein